MSIEKNTGDMEETICTVDDPEDTNSVACKVRRKIEDYLERRRYKDELGDLGEQLAIDNE